MPGLRPDALPDTGGAGLVVAALLVLPGAVAIGLSLGLLGSGGSILTVPVLVYLAGQEEKVAIAGSLAIVGLIALVGSVPYIRERLVEWRSVVLFGVPGMAGTYLGAWSSVFVSGAVQLSVFALVMVAAAYLMLKPIEVQPSGPRRASWRIGVDGVAVGALTGFVGVGGGFLIVPALVLLGGLCMHRAVATSLVVIAMKSAVGFATYVNVLTAEGLHLDLNVISLVGAVGIAGSLLGSYVAQKIPKQQLQRGFGIMLIVMGVFILSTTAPGVFH